MNSPVPQAGFHVVLQLQTPSCGLPLQQLSCSNPMDGFIASDVCYDIQHACLERRTLGCAKVQSQPVVLSLSECLVDSSEESAGGLSMKEVSFAADPASRRQRRRAEALANSKDHVAKQRADAKTRYADIDSVPSPFPWPREATTVMVRNMPNRYTVEEFLADMPNAGIEGTFDFFHLPMDFRTKRNRGYGFISLLSVDAAENFARTFHGTKLQRCTTTKVVAVSPALTQGLEANIAQYTRNDARRIQNPWFCPLMFKDDMLA